ncbi:hypothetical protein BJ322DRAFT_1114242 [Thelephora terrestris]|uniref:F-box domain-containing protein n=1 Tax=Thelephora terrestris TaxID=56493 RepID=A0A9P6H338_9AGAM|nr:hypothetical protein BJ322DRAFT_1114242 [Thelephora terrestris]
MSQAFIPHGEVGPWSPMEVAAVRPRNSQHAAILRLPTEILVSILRKVIKAGAGYQKAVQLVTSICRHLRTLVFGIPELWGFISMRGSLGPLFLERCQGNPISVVPYFMEGDAEGNERILRCLNYWRGMQNLHLTRLEVVEFCGSFGEFLAVRWIFNYPMPKLETLTLASGALVTSDVVPLEDDADLWNINPITQRTLKEVHLQQVFVPWTSNIFYGLSTLHLDYRKFIPGAISITMDAFLEVLSHSPRLESCSLHFALPQCYDEEFLRNVRPTRTVVLAFLEGLALFDKTLNVAYLLRHIRYPPAAKVLLKVDTPPNELEGLLSILCPTNSPIFDAPSQISFQRVSVIESRPALEIGCTKIQYLDEWAEILGPNDITYTTFTLLLVEAIHRAGPSIRHLKISLGCELVMQPAVLKEILGRLPNLEVLSYAPGEDAVHDWPAFWDILCQTGENGLICQSLRTLRVVTTKEGVTPDVVACVVARWRLERPLGVFQLRVLNLDRSLASQMIARLRPFVGQLVLEVIEESKVVRLT